MSIEMYEQELRLVCDCLMQDGSCTVFTINEVPGIKIWGKITPSLVQKGVRCVYINLGEIISSCSEDWVKELINKFTEQLDINSSSMVEFWSKAKLLNPLYQFYIFIKTIVANQKQKTVVCYDSWEKMGERNREDFLSHILSQAKDEGLEEINFCLIGVCYYGESVTAQMSNFNVGRRVVIGEDMLCRKG